MRPPWRCETRITYTCLLYDVLQDLTEASSSIVVVKKHSSLHLVLATTASVLFAILLTLLSLAKLACEKPFQVIDRRVHILRLRRHSNGLVCALQVHSHLRKGREAEKRGGRSRSINRASVNTRVLANAARRSCTAWWHTTGVATRCSVAWHTKPSAQGKSAMLGRQSTPLRCAQSVRRASCRGQRGVQPSCAAQCPAPH